MKINTKNFRYFGKAIDISYQKGNYSGERMYLDFQESCAYFSNKNFIARLDFDYESGNEDIERIMVDKKMFLTLCRQYEELYLNEDYEFSAPDTGETFKIQFDTEEQDFPNFEHEDFEKHNIDLSLLSDMKMASNYTGTYDLSENYYGIELLEDRVVAGDGAQLFESIISEDSGELPDIKLHGGILKLIIIVADLVLNSVDTKKYASIKYNTNTDEIYFTFGENEELVIATTQQDDLRLPDVKDPEFIQNYSHETGFTISKSDILDILKFFEVFVKHERNERLFLKVKNSSTLSIENQAESKGNRLIDIQDNSLEESAGIWFPRAKVVKAIDSIKDDFIRFEIDPEGNAFNITGKDNERRHVATIRLD